MTPNQAIWGNGYHTGVRDTLLVVALAAVVLGIIWIANRKKKTADVQPPTYGYLPPLMQY